MMTFRQTILSIGLVLAIAFARPVPARTQNQGLAMRVAALETLVATLQNQVAVLQTTDTSLQNQINNVVPENLLDLANYVSVDFGTLNGLSGPHIIFTDANVHIRNGSGFTNGRGHPAGDFPGGLVNGLGNLIVGYNEASLSGSVRTGSHNLVVGPGHSYSSFGGFVAGYFNKSLGAYTSVTGGHDNTANGTLAAVTGGGDSTASGYAASVSGGIDNIASGNHASVSGGVVNAATGQYATVSGGRSQTASTPDSHVP